MEQRIIESRRRQVIYDQKWKKLLSRSWVFRYLPFIEFVIAAGSMALGNVNRDSDFDVIVGVRLGRIFTARFFLIVTLDILGWRRRNLDHNISSRDTICLNHFVTVSSYRLREPHNKYWQELYRNLVPIFGKPEVVREFFKANEDWLKWKINYLDDLRHRYNSPSGFKFIIERALNGRLGNWLEGILRKPQLKRIEEKLKPALGYKPRLVYGDEELELHLDTKRTEEFAADEILKTF